MKLISTFVAVFLATAFVASASLANSYVSAYGGVNWDDVISTPFVDNESGHLVGTTVGTKINSLPGVRAELDISFRTNEVELFGGAISADHQSFGVLGNVVWDLPVKVGISQPYVLAGVGYGHSSATFENVSLLKLESSGIAYQLGAGLNVPVAEGISAGIGYRYFASPEIEVLGTELSNGTNHSLIVSLTIDLG